MQKNKITDKQIHDIDLYSFNNRKAIEQSTIAGCYYCKKIFDPRVKKIEEYVNKETTALCPFCGIDSVIGNVSNSIDINDNNLHILNKFWF